MEAILEGLSMCASVILHLLKKGAINVNKKRIGIIAGDNNFEEFEQMSNNHPVGEIPTCNYEML